MQVIEEYVLDLTGASLQSAPELAKTAAALGLPKTVVDVTRLTEIFGIRNKIIHELDINLDSERRKRTLRGREPMMKHTKALLQVGEDILMGVDRQLATQPSFTITFAKPARRSHVVVAVPGPSSSDSQG